MGSPVSVAVSFPGKVSRVIFVAPSVIEINVIIERTALHMYGHHSQPKLSRLCRSILPIVTRNSIIDHIIKSMRWSVHCLIWVVCTYAVMTIEAEYAMDLRISEATNDTLKLEWSCPVVEQMYTVKLQDLGERKTVTKSVKADDKSCSVEFTDLQPITHYVAALSLDGQDKALSTIKALTRPTLEMPEIYFVHEGCADLTLAPLPEDQAKHVTGYLLLVQPLEDAKDYPDTVIADTALKLELEALVKPPFYIAYEFTQDQLATDGGGEVRVGSGTAKKDGQYGTIQDPKLTSGAYYRVVLVVITEVDAKRVLFAEESCRMLIK